jgi:hypothetical protein
MLASEEFGLLLVKLLDHVILGICSFPFIHCHSYFVKVGPLLLLLDAVPVVWILAQSSNSFPKNCQSWSPTNSACEFPTTSTTLRKRFKNPFLRHCNGIAHGSCHAFFFLVLSFFLWLISFGFVAKTYKNHRTSALGLPTDHPEGSTRSTEVAFGLT